MPQISLFPETIVRSDGVGPSVEISHETGKLLVLTLGITRILEHESLQLAIHGSADGIAWGPLPLVSMPQKSYCGIYSTLMNLSKHPDVRYLRAQWRMNRRRIVNSGPLFAFYVEAEASGSRLHAASASVDSLYEEVAVA